MIEEEFNYLVYWQIFDRPVSLSGLSGVFCEAPAPLTHYWFMIESAFPGANFSPSLIQVINT